MKDLKASKVLSLTSELTVYKTIMEDKTIGLFKKSLEDNLSKCSSLFYSLMEIAEELGYEGNLLKSHLINIFITNENIFSLACENNTKVSGSSLYNMALNDIEILKELLNVDLKELFPISRGISEIVDYKPITEKRNLLNNNINFEDDSKDILENLIRYYNKSGCGKIARFSSFKYDKEMGIVEIKNPDSITFDDLIGYKAQIDQIKNNTEAFIKGFSANNVLLVGARGTGKSSSVKALANAYFENGLRIIEITKEQIQDLPKILSVLKNRGRYFIIFIDDLSFDEQEIQYKYLKTLLDGGSESKPNNVLFYVTSNRRHLIQEKWSDRSRGSEDAEIHTMDTLNEKLALSDRFGITITFPKPTPQEYINMVIEMAKRNNIKMTEEKIRSLALRWELNQKGMSGRTARQFINNILWETQDI